MLNQIKYETNKEIIALQKNENVTLLHFKKIELKTMFRSLDDN